MAFLRADAHQSSRQQPAQTPPEVRPSSTAGLAHGRRERPAQAALGPERGWWRFLGVQTQTEESSSGGGVGFTALSPVWIEHKFFP